MAQGDESEIQTFHNSSVSVMIFIVQRSMLSRGENMDMGRGTTNDDSFQSRTMSPEIYFVCNEWVSCIASPLASQVSAKFKVPKALVVVSEVRQGPWQMPGLSHSGV